MRSGNDGPQNRPLADDQKPIVDLRSALARVARHRGQLIETDHPVDPIGELAGVYRYIGVGGTCPFAPDLDLEYR